MYRPLPAEIEKYNVAEKERPPPTHIGSSSSSANRTPLNIPVIPEPHANNRLPDGVVQGQGQTSANGYIEAMKKVELSRKGTKCKREYCTNFGNSQKEGYCNSCYPEVLRDRTPRGATDDMYQCC